MNTYELKNYIYENNYVVQLLESINCHHIRYHTSNDYYTCGNPDGDNPSAIVVYNSEKLTCVDYTRVLVKNKRTTDIIDLIAFFGQYTFHEALLFICNQIGISLYQDFEEDIPESFKILKMLEEMNTNLEIEEEKPLKPISERILSYYKPYVNDMFYKDGIDYQTQRDFNIGYDDETNRISIPIYSIFGDLVGVKGRLFKDKIDEGECKYLYLAQCNKSQILYGLHKTMPYIKQANSVYVFESEKSVLQCWSQGIRNTCATGGKQISKYQIDILIRLGVKIIFCYDKDVQQTELEDISERFVDGVNVYAVIDKDNILEDKQSPSDDPKKLLHLMKNNIYLIK